MKISEMINELYRQLEVHGDVDVEPTVTLEKRVCVCKIEEIFCEDVGLMDDPTWIVCTIGLKPLSMS